MNFDHLKGASVLVTGATGGIGSEIAKLCYRNEASVRIQGRNAAKLKKIETACKTAGGGGAIDCFACDFLRENEYLRILDGVEFDFVFVAHGAFVAPDVDLTEREKYDLFRVNVLSVQAIVQKIAAQKRELNSRRLTRMVAITSRAAHGSRAGCVHYAATKGALNSMIKTYGNGFLTMVSIVGAEPGIVNTPMIDGRKYPPSEVDSVEDVASETVALSIHPPEESGEILPVGPAYRGAIARN